MNKIKLIHDSLRYDNRKIPILSRKEISRMGEMIAEDFSPGILKNPHPIDVDDFIENYLHLRIDYQYLSHNFVYQAVMNFKQTDCFPIYDIRTGRAEYISVDANTIVIDPRMLEGDRHTQYKFALGHEGSHFIEHAEYYLNQKCDTWAAIKCKTEKDVNVRRKAYRNDSRFTGKRLQTDLDWIEWQANELSSAILMPEQSVMKLWDKKGPFRLDPVSLLMNTFDVSRETAYYRLKNLGLL